MNAEQIIILSASGSIRVPKFVINFRERAILPSRKSVTPATEKKIKASESLTGERENIAQRNAPVSTKRETVSLLGKFTRFFYRKAGADAKPQTEKV